ncbi:MAG: polysaccharide deacetylase family protein [Desulfobulbaceae bacterium]|jgi:peptidoglycan/xylan/chitin deacetylase (PgdA/CDA1 family)|nr:polysaccharide deacetylase family protein [Desulfobulbaceae bacterium]
MRFFRPICAYSPAEQCGFLALTLAAPFLFSLPKLAIVPLSAFVIACFIAPFFSASRFFLPVISRGRSGRPWISITFDDGPNPDSTPDLLDFLRNRGIVACFFVNGEPARRFPDLVRQIANDGHLIGNHSTTHDNLLMFRGAGRVRKEIGETQKILAELGIQTKYFRPPIGIVTPRYAAAALAFGLDVVTFRRRPRDLGNRRIDGLARRILADIRGDDILLLHDAPPKKACVATWLAELDWLFAGLEARGFGVVALDRLLGETD